MKTDLNSLLYRKKMVYNCFRSSNLPAFPYTAALLQNWPTTHTSIFPRSNLSKHKSFVNSSVQIYSTLVPPCSLQHNSSKISFFSNFYSVQNTIPHVLSLKMSKQEQKHTLIARSRLNVNSNKDKCVLLASYSLSYDTEREKIYTFYLGP